MEPIALFYILQKVSVKEYAALWDLKVNSVRNDHTSKFLLPKRPD